MLSAPKLRRLSPESPQPSLRLLLELASFAEPRLLPDVEGGGERNGPEAMFSGMDWRPGRRGKRDREVGKEGGKEEGERREREGVGRVEEGKGRRTRGREMELPFSGDSNGDPPRDWLSDVWLLKELSSRPY